MSDKETNLKEIILAIKKLRSIISLFKNGNNKISYKQYKEAKKSLPRYLLIISSISKVKNLENKLNK